MAKIDLTWPTDWKSAPASAEIYDNSDPKNTFWLAGDTDYISGTTITAAVTGGAAGTLYGGNKNKDAAGNVYLHVSGANMLDVYGGGQNASVDGDIYIYLAGGTVRNVYGGSKSKGSVGAVRLQIAAGAAIAGNVYLGGSGSGAKAKSADLTVSGENALAGFTGLLDGQFYNADTRKKESGTLTFSEATTDFSGKLSNFSKVSLEKSSVTLNHFNLTKNYKNIGQYSIGADSTLTISASKKYTADTQFSGSGTLVFAGNVVHTIKSSSTTFEGKLQISAGATLDMQGSFLSTTTDKAEVSIADGGILQFSKKSVELKSKLTGEAGAVVSAKDTALTVSGDITGFKGTFSAAGKGSLTLKSSVKDENITALNLNFDGKQTGSITLAAEPEDTLDLNISGYNGKLYLQGYKYNIKSNTAEKLTVYGGGSNMVIDFDPAANTMIDTVIGGTSSHSIDMSSYKTVVKNGSINNIYGGGESTQVAWGGAVSATLDLEGGVINYVYGGNKGFVGSAAAGDVVLNLSGATVNKDVYGGGYVCTNGMSASAASVTINFTAGTVLGNIYGGGRVHPAYTVYYKDYDTGTIKESSSVAASSISGNVQITLEGGAAAGGNIYINGSAGQGKTYIDGEDNFIKFSKVYNEHEEPVDPEKPEEGSQTVPASALAGFTGLLKGNYRTSKGKSEKGQLIFSDYQVEFLGRIDGFEQVSITDKSSLTLNWDLASKRYKNIDVFDVAAESTFSITATKKTQAKLNLSGAGTTVLASAQLYEFTGNLSKFHGTVQVNSGATMLIKHKNSILTNNDPKRIATVDLQDGAKLQFNLSATFGAAVAGTTASVITVEKKNNLKLVFNGDLTSFNGTMQLLNSKNAFIEIATTQWNSLNFEVQGNKSWYETVRITAGSGSISTAGYKGMYFLFGNEVAAENRDSTESVIYGGGQEENVASTNFSVSSAGTTSYAKVFAGGLKSAVEGDASATVKSGSIDELFGGGDGKNAAVAGTSGISVQGGSIGSIYGGGYLSGKGTNTVGHAEINLSGATVTGNIYAGGYAVKGATVTVGSAEVIFGTGVQFSGDVYGTGYAADKKSSATVEGDSKVTFEDFTGAFAGMIHDFLSFSVKGNTEVYFSKGQSGAATVKNFIFDITGRAEGLGAMLTVSAEDKFDFVNADLIQLTIDRSTLFNLDPGTQQGYILSDGAVYDLNKTFKLSGLNGSNIYELAIGGEIVLNDERYRLVLSNGILQLQYVVGDSGQVALTWSRSFIDRAAPLSAKQYADGTELNFAGYGYTDADNSKSLKVKIGGTYADITAGAAGVEGNIWLNVTGTGNTLTVKPENAAVRDVNIRIANAWDTLRAGEDGAIAGNVYISLEAAGTVNSIYAGSNVAGETQIIFDGSYASNIYGASNTIVIFNKNYDALDSSMNNVGEIRIGNQSVTMAAGGINGGGTLSIGADGVFQIAAAEDAVFSVGTQAISGTGAFTVKSGTVNLTGNTDGFTGKLTVAGGQLNLNGGESGFSNAILSVSGGKLVYALNGKDAYTIANKLSGSGAVRFENASGGALTTVTINTSLKDFSGTFELGENTNAILSGKYGPATTVSGTLANIFNITGTSYDAEEETKLVNKGTSVYLNRNELTVSENSGRVIYGGIGDYTAESHTVTINDKFISAEESAEFFAGAGSGTTIGKGQTATSWSSATISNSAINVTVSDFKSKIDTLYGGSVGGTVNGDVLITIASGEIGTIFAAGENTSLTSTKKNEETGEETTVYYNTWVNITGKDAKIGTIYGAAANSGTVKNVSIRASNGEIGSIYAGGTGDSSVTGDVTIDLTGNDTVVTGDIIINQAKGKGTVTLTSTRDSEAKDEEETGLGKLTGTIDGGYIKKVEAAEGVEAVEGTGDRVLKFSSYKNNFNGTFIGFLTVDLVKSTVTLKGENKTFKANTITIDKDSTLIFAGTGAMVKSLEDGTAAFSGAGVLQFSTDMTFDGGIEKLTGTINADMKTVKKTETDEDGKETTTETKEKATLTLQSKLFSTVNLGGKGNIIIAGETAENGSSIKGSFSDNATLYTNNKNVLITEGTFANIDLGSNVESTEDLSLKFSLTSSKTVAIRKDIYLGSTTGTSKAVFTGDGSKFTFEGKLYGDEKSSSRILAFEGYSGRFSGNIEKITRLELRGDSKVSFYAASAQSGATSFLFDVSERSSSLSGTAMMTTQDNILFDLGAAAARDIIIDAAKLGSGGSFTLVTSSDALTALLEKNFTVYEKGAETGSFDLTVGGGIFTWNDFDWKLDLNSAKTSLTLSWTRSTSSQQAVASMSASALSDELLRGRNSSFAGTLASPGLY